MSVIVPKAARHYLARMSLRPLFTMLIAFAMLFAPLGLSSASAVAMASSPNHHAQMMESGHCGERPANGDHGKAPDKSCCVAMCAAITVAPSASIEPRISPQPIDQPSLVQFNHSFLAELATPPPRLA